MSLPLTKKRTSRSPSLRIVAPPRPSAACGTLSGTSRVSVRSGNGAPPGDGTASASPHQVKPVPHPGLPSGISPGKRESSGDGVGDEVAVCTGEGLGDGVGETLGVDVGVGDGTSAGVGDSLTS